MTVESVLTMLGGIGMFLYGMKLMGNALERAAGAKMEKILERLTSSKPKGIILGAGVTAVIQSSAATIIMVVGFLNAGILKLAQGVPVIMGANIGTTVTAQILRMGDIDGGSFILTMLKPSSFAPILIALSAFIILMTKKQSLKDKMEIFMGLGILFMGMTLMESSFAPLAESPEFSRIFTIFENPILGVFAGMAVTILLQSSSASVGVLQATASTGIVTFAMAAPITIGCNLGKCVTVLLASIGVNKDAKRAVTIDVTMCVLGSVLFLIGVYIYQGVIGFSFWEDPVSRGTVANFHTLFNLLVAVFFLPLVNVLIKISKVIIKDKPGRDKMEEELVILDSIFLDRPDVALEQCRKVIGLMFTTDRDSFNKASTLIDRYDDNVVAHIDENESFVDKSETILGEYILKITQRPLSFKQRLLATEFLHTVGDLERVGDHVVNLKEEAQLLHNDGISYSGDSLREMSFLVKAIDNILMTTQKAYEENDIPMALRAQTLEEVIDDMVDTMKKNHIDRLQDGRCTVERGVSFIEMLTDIERISDHCFNVSSHLIQRIESKELSTHDADPLTEMTPEEMAEIREELEELYLNPIR
ncbi:MAG: Na/Pi cotransporter family protein [Clostridiales bacterium]|nr:Na/Pi cotransporter family protein [Clostridiales bacterium]